MLTWLLELGTHYGYIIVFFGVMVESMGVPVPGETALLVGSVLAGTGQLNIIIVGVVGWAAAVIGDNVGYAVGRRYGRRLIALRPVRRIYRPEHVLAAEAMFEHRGWMAVFFGRFVAILRIFAGPLAGMHRMPWRRFVVANAAGAVMWVGVVCLIGQIIGRNIARADNVLTTLGYDALALVVLLAAGYVALALRRGGRRR